MNLNENYSTYKLLLIYLITIYYIASNCVVINIFHKQRQHCVVPDTIDICHIRHIYTSWEYPPFRRVSQLELRRPNGGLPNNRKYIM